MIKIGRREQKHLTGVVLTAQKMGKSGKSSCSSEVVAPTNHSERNTGTTKDMEKLLMAPVCAHSNK